MKIVLISLLCLILIGITSYSYAQFTVVEKNTKLPEVLLQIEVRDSNGGLVSYVETNQVIGFSPLELNTFLDVRNQSSTEFFMKDNKKYESQQFETTTRTGGTFDEKLAYSSSRLLLPVQEEVFTLLQMRHDSYQTQPGMDDDAVLAGSENPSARGLRPRDEDDADRQALSCEPGLGEASQATLA